ncbi:flavodoxin family protein [Oceanobacillus neutriphilus]|uniref:NAD(P)H-dependent FMN-containing oxidoreductase YwqN n=1 Tax=Oceanobacillus neutriphilus TaxID=531815 RepID=A0ABQ2NR74_9BACI|nr:flavodoxin family protein [Oceanobacillus neutriphilus]GGP09795.1 putative NAD(P)H-dependent FMN-containing oxidoreductase YwqN [Oceanobacillus neutriphilus]
MSIIVFHGSTRKNSNTELLTYEAVPMNQGTHVYLRDYTIHPIIDQRHDINGFTPVNDHHTKLIDQLLEHDTVVFATPIYWYSMSVLMKLFIDRWSQILRDSDYPDFREKLSKKNVYVIIVGGDNPFIKGLPLIQQFQYICDFYKMHFAGYIIGKASKPGDILNDTRAFKAASTLIPFEDNK